MITARIRLEVPRETVVLVADTQHAVDNIIEALREDGVYEDHAVISGGGLKATTVSATTGAGGSADRALTPTGHTDPGRRLRSGRWYVRFVLSCVL